MSERAIKYALRTVKNHGFNVTPLINGVAIEIPWWNPDTKASGVDVVECHTIAEVGVALGY